MSFNIPTPDLSIIIPTYNRLPLLKEALDSFVGRLTCSYEVIIVDDGSTDGTPDYLRTLGEPCRVFFQEHKGGNAARNYGMREARGRYVKFLDDDDLLDPTSVSNQVEFLEKLPDKDVCYSNGKLLFQTSDRTEPDSARTFMVGEMGDPLDYLLDSLYLWPANFTFLYKHEALLDIAFDESLPVMQDIDFNARVAIRGTEFVYFPETLGWRRVVEGDQHQHVFRTDSIVRIYTHRRIIDKMVVSLRQTGKLTVRRRYLLAKHYFDLAERIFPHKQRFRELIACALELYPDFEPDRPRFRRMVKLLGYELSEWIVYLRGRLVYRGAR